MKKSIARAAVALTLPLALTTMAASPAQAAEGYRGCVGSKRVTVVISTSTTQIHQHWVQGNSAQAGAASGTKYYRYTNSQQGDWQGGIKNSNGQNYWTGSGASASSACT